MITSHMDIVAKDKICSAGECTVKVDCDLINDGILAITSWEDDATIRLHQNTFGK